MDTLVMIRKARTDTTPEKPIEASDFQMKCNSFFKKIIALQNSSSEQPEEKTQDDYVLFYLLDEGIFLICQYLQYKDQLTSCADDIQEIKNIVETHYLTMIVFYSDKATDELERNNFLQTINYCEWTYSYIDFFLDRLTLIFPEKSRDAQRLFNINNNSFISASNCILLISIVSSHLRHESTKKLTTKKLTDYVQILQKIANKFIPQKMCDDIRQKIEEIQRILVLSDSADENTEKLIGRKLASYAQSLYKIIEKHNYQIMREDIERQTKEIDKLFDVTSKIGAQKKTENSSRPPLSEKPKKQEQEKKAFRKKPNRGKKKRKPHSKGKNKKKKTPLTLAQRLNLPECNGSSSINKDSETPPDAPEQPDKSMPSHDDKSLQPEHDASSHASRQESEVSETQPLPGTPKTPRKKSARKRKKKKKPSRNLSIRQNPPKCDDGSPDSQQSSEVSKTLANVSTQLGRPLMTANNKLLKQDLTDTPQAIKTLTPSTDLSGYIPKWDEEIKQAINFFSEILKDHDVCAFLFGGAMRGNPTDLDIVLFPIGDRESLDKLNAFISYLMDYIEKLPEVSNIKRYKTAIGRQALEFEFNGVKFDLSWYPKNIFASLEDALQNHKENNDFTINALYLNLITNEVVDPSGEAAKAKDSNLLKTVIDTRKSFSEHPERILRAIRLLTRYDLKISDSTRDIINKLFENYNYFTDIDQSRVYQEYVKLFFFGHGKKAFRVLKELKLLDKLFPHLKDLSPQEKNFTEDLILDLLDEIDVARRDGAENIYPHAIVYFAIQWFHIQRDIRTTKRATMRLQKGNFPKLNDTSEITCWKIIRRLIESKPSATAPTEPTLNETNPLSSPNPNGVREIPLFDEQNQGYFSSSSCPPSPSKFEYGFFSSKTLTPEALTPVTQTPVIPVQPLPSPQEPIQQFSHYSKQPGHLSFTRQTPKTNSSERYHSNPTCQPIHPSCPPLPRTSGYGLFSQSTLTSTPLIPITRSSAPSTPSQEQTSQRDHFKPRYDGCSRMGRRLQSIQFPIRHTAA
jgi:hypothetical protein